MEVMLIGGTSQLMRALISKLQKEGHHLYVLTGSKDRSVSYPHACECYYFHYDSPSVGEVFQSVRPDVTIIMGAFDTNLSGQDPKAEAVSFAAGLQNILLSWAVLEKGRLLFLSSSEVFSGTYPNLLTEQEPPSPRGIRPLMLYQGEESCLFYHRQLGRDVLVLRLDRLHAVPEDALQAVATVTGRMCLDAFRDETVVYRSNNSYGFVYLGDAVQSISQLAACEGHRHPLYHISGSGFVSEKDLQQAIYDCMGSQVTYADNTTLESFQVALSQERLLEEFGFSVWKEPTDTVKETLSYMQRHSHRFLEEDHPGVHVFQRLYYRFRALFGALVPYLETLVLFIPFFMLNNRAVDSRYFSRIDFYLLYVLLLAIVHGQQQATFAASLATAGYLFRQMYYRTGLSVVTDYNTYVWIAEIFILGLVVGYMKDSIRFFREERNQEVDFLQACVSDIRVINDSNQQMKEDLIHQVSAHEQSLGMIYDTTKLLQQSSPDQVLHQAILVLQKLMRCRDAAIYRVSEDGIGTVNAFSSERALSLGRSLSLRELSLLAEAFEKNQVFFNRKADPAYPAMAYLVPGKEDSRLLLLVWNLPIERMTIPEADRLTVIGSLIQSAIEHAQLQKRLQEAEALTQERNLYDPDKR